MVCKTTKKDLAPVAKFINEMYSGNALDLARYLDHAVYLMHYLPDDFPEREIKNTCYALKGLKEKLLEGHYKKKGTPFVQLDC